jgi:hypothetical protein
VKLECAAVNDRPLHCAMPRNALPDPSFTPAALQVASAARLSAPAGVWPLAVVVEFRRTPLPHPLVSYC